MEIGKTKIQAGPITFALQHRYLDGGRLILRARGEQAAAVDRDLVAAKLPVVESTLREMAKAASVRS